MFANCWQKLAFGPSPISDVPRDELAELKSVFCKIFDPDMSPLGFDARQMYQFISERYRKTSTKMSPMNPMNFLGYSFN